jgi:hypothetical protein
MTFDTSDPGRAKPVATVTTLPEGVIAVDETDRLIASDKVAGTAVYDPKGQRLGTVHNFMVDKVSGQAAYAVLSFGGFLGLGERFYPLPWPALRYAPEHGGYVVDLDKVTSPGATPIMPATSMAITVSATGCNGD